MTYTLWLYPGDPGTQFTKDFNYTTGEIWSKSKFSQGKLEALIKIPKGKGIVSAFWLFGGALWNEIDIFEFLNNNYTKIMTTLHHDIGNGHKQCSETFNGGIDYSLEFHKYGVSWENNKICFFVDNILIWQQYHTYTSGLFTNPVECERLSGNAYRWNKVFPNEPMQIILNSGTAAKEELKPDETTPFPGVMEVEWIKYYRRCIPCNDYAYSSQYLLSSTLYNSIIGKNIELSNNCIGSGMQLKIIADNSVLLGSNFEVQLGGVFEIKIDNAICNN